MRKMLVRALLLVVVAGVPLMSMTVAAHADCAHGDTYDAHGSRCR